MIDWNKLRAMQPNSEKRFSPVRTPSQGPGNRDSEGGVLTPSGRFKLNFNASDYWHAVVKETKNLPPTYVVYFGVNEERKLVAAYPVVSGTPGASPVRLTPREGSIQELDVTLYLDGVFADYPSLRVKGRRKVAVSVEKDWEGKPYLEINLASQLAMRTVSRKGSAGEEEGDDDESEDE